MFTPAVINPETTVCPGAKSPMFCAVTVNAVSVVNATSVPSVIVAFNGILNPEEQFNTPVTACVVILDHLKV